MGAVCCNQQGQDFEELSEFGRAGAGKGGRGRTPSPGGDAIMMMMVVVGNNQWTVPARSTHDDGTFDPFFHPWADADDGEEDYCQQYWPLHRSAAFARMNTWEAAEKARPAQFVASPRLASRGSEGWWALEKGAGRGESRCGDCRGLRAPAQEEHDGSIEWFELQTWWVQEQEIQLYKRVWKTNLREGLLFCPLTKSLVYHAS